VTASFDLCLVSDGGPPSEGGGAIGDEVKVLKRTHVMNVKMAPWEKKEQVWRVEIPSSKALVNANIDELRYR